MSTSHTTICPFSPPAAHVSPSGENAAQYTLPMPHANDRSSFHVVASQYRTKPSAPALIKTFPSAAQPSAHRRLPAGAGQNGGRGFVAALDRPEIGVLAAGEGE